MGRADFPHMAVCGWLNLPSSFTDLPPIDFAVRHLYPDNTGPPLRLFSCARDIGMRPIGPLGEITEQAWGGDQLSASRLVRLKGYGEFLTHSSKGVARLADA